MSLYRKLPYIGILVITLFFIFGCNAPNARPESKPPEITPTTQSEYEISLEKTVSALNSIVSEMKLTAAVTEILPTQTLQATLTPFRFSNLCPDPFIYDDVLVKIESVTRSGNNPLIIKLSLQGQTDQRKFTDDIYFFTLLNAEGRKQEEFNGYCPDQIWPFPHIVDVFSHKSMSAAGNYCFDFEGSSPIELIFHEQKAGGTKEVCSWKLNLP